MFDHSADSAWPHRKGDKPNGPLIVYFTWGGKKNDDFWIGHLKLTLARIHDKALGPNCIVDNAPVYCNMALADVTSVEQIYRDNLSDLSALRAKYDPSNVMGRTGGFRIPFGLSGLFTINNA